MSALFISNTKQKMKNLKIINTEDWPRLEEVIRYTGLSANKFAQFIGLPAAENLYRIKRGQNGISRALADRIIEYCPEISKGWLLTGEGNMLRDDI